MLVYCVTNTVNGKQYVGKTTKSLDRRWRMHLWEARRGYRRLFCRAIRKYGAESFTIRVLQECETIAELDERERYWIATLKTLAPSGYNRTAGGPGGPSQQTQRTREKISATKQNSGYRHSEAARAKIAARSRQQSSTATCWEGIQYPSRAAAARALGITTTAMSDRINRGHSCDADLRPNAKRVKGKRSSD